MELCIISNEYNVQYFVIILKHYCLELIHK